jgi:hypothetical protein
MQCHDTIDCWPQAREVKMTVIENVAQKLAELPPGSQLEVLDFVEFLAKKSSQPRPLFNPEGLWAGGNADVSPEDIAEARREMWGRYSRQERQ